jgi:outer membrane lipoprotein-sorting protein
MSQRDDKPRDVLQDFVEAAREDAPSEAECNTARARLAAAIESHTKGSTMMNTIRKFYTKPVGWLAFAATVLVAAALILATLQPGGSSAWATAIHTIRSARTLTYRATVENPVPQDAAGSNQGLLSSALMQLIPKTMEIQIAYKEPGLLRETLPFGGVMVMDVSQGKAVAILETTKQFIEMDLSTLPPEQRSANIIDQLRSLPARADQALGRRELGGRTVEDYRTTTNGVAMLITIDARTGDLVRMEGEFLNMPGMKFVATDFQFNVPLDDALFSLTPPPGYKRVPVKMDLSAPSEKDLLYTLRYWAEHARGGAFPPSLSPLDLAAGMSELTTAFRPETAAPPGVTTQAVTDVMEAMQGPILEQSMRISRGFVFVMTLDPKTDWHYSGKGVKLGEADKVIFRYKPVGSPTYRAIFGDLKIMDVTVDDQLTTATAREVAP